MICASIAPVSPPLAGRFECQIAGVSSREDVLEVAVALHAVRRELGDVDVARPVVAVLDQQPAAVAAAARAGDSGRSVRTSTHDPFSL